MTLKSIRRQDDKHISNHLRVFLISLSIIVGATIFLSAEIAYWVSRIRMPKGGFTTIVLSFLFGGFGHIIPFVGITMIVWVLIRKGAGKTEIFIKLAFMLIPVSIVTAYSLFKYIDPFARMFFLSINVWLLLVGLLLGIAVCKIRKSQ